MIRFALFLSFVFGLLGEATAQSCGGSALAASAGCGGVASVYRVRRAPLRSRLYASRLSRQSAGCGGQSVKAVQVQVVAPRVSAEVCPCGCNLPGCNCGQPPRPELDTPVIFGTNPKPVGAAYGIALASAQYRAANGIHGHSPIDSRRTSGVGWASSNPMPMTCLGRGGSNYAVVLGRDGWYASKIGN